MRHQDRHRHGLMPRVAPPGTNSLAGAAHHHEIDGVVGCGRDGSLGSGARLVALDVTQLDGRPSRTDGVAKGSKAKGIPAMWASNAAPIEMAKSGGLSTRSAGRIGFAPTRAMACRVQALHCRGRENSPSRPYDSGDDGCRSADDQRTILGPVPCLHVSMLAARHCDTTARCRWRSRRGGWFGRTRD
jgi:hypothetical protein